MNVGIVLSAGASRRMGRNKALMRSGRLSFLVQCVRSLWSACDTVIVVLGADAKNTRARVEAEFVRLVEAGALRRDLAGARRRGSRGSRGLEVHMVVNRSWRRGMLGSARMGLRAAMHLAPEALLVLPVDHPGVRPATVAALATAMDAALGAYGGTRARTSGFAYALIPRYRRRRGHPLALSPALARAMMSDAGAADLSDAVRRSARLVGYLDCGDSGVVRNRNRPGD